MHFTRGAVQQPLSLKKMKQRCLIRRLCALLSALLFLCFETAIAQTGEKPGSDGKSASPFPGSQELAACIAEGVLAFQIASEGRENYTDWFYAELLGKPGSEWIILTLIQYGYPIDVDACIRYLDEIVQGTRVLSASEQMKYALTYYALGAADSECIHKALAESVGAQGVMSYIYGLHLLNNGLKSPLYTAEALVDALLSMRKSDGGWAVMGNYSDSDVTSMALQALAPYCREDGEVKAAVENALDFLSTKQLDDGAFSGFGGGENPESTAQAIIALCALGIDPDTDERFIKSGSSALDGLALFRLDDGSFCHQFGAGYNATSTLQSFMAAVSLLRFYSGKDSIYLFDGVYAKLDALPEQTAGETKNAKNELENALQKEEPIPYKIIALLICLALLLLTLAVLWLKGKRNYKSYLFAALCFAAAAAVILLTNFESRNSYYSGERVKKPDAIGSVSMTIRCDTIKAYIAQNEFIPEDGILLPMTEFNINRGETAYDILTQAAREYSIQLDSTGSGISLLYVKGIGFIYEYEFGEQSGWMYYVNGIAPSVNSAEYVLSDGDVIQWMYSRDIGQDLKDYILKPDSRQ